MESSEVLKKLEDFDDKVPSCVDASVQLRRSSGGIENPGNELLDGLDSYLEDIDDRLTISRMVSDSVIKGMVNAVMEESAEKIAKKELKVVALKEKLNFCHLGMDNAESSGSLELCSEPKRTNQNMHLGIPQTLEELDCMKQCLANLKILAEDQIKKLSKEVSDEKGCTIIRRRNSQSELLGLGGILQEKVPEKLVELDKTIIILKDTLSTIFEQVDDVVYLSKESVSRWQKERKIQEELEAMVIQNSIKSMRQEFEIKIWEEREQFCGKKSNMLSKVNELSSLRQELDAISKSLSIPEMGQPSLHGSHDIGDEWNNAKWKDHSHRKVLGNHISSSTSHWEGNGKLEESKNIKPENIDPAQLKHMPKDELISYFKTEMTKMKRNHESIVQEITEDYFILKREFLRGRWSSSPLRKDKDFDILRKKIPEVILKLDDILTENEKSPTFCDDSDNLSSLKNRLDTLPSENRQLRDLLTDRRKEVKCLSPQVAHAVDKMSHHSLVEANLLKQMRKLKALMEDAKIETAVGEEVYKCVLREVACQTRCDIEESDVESIIMQEIHEIIFRGAIKDAEATIKWEIENSELVAIVMQEIWSIILQETVRESGVEINLTEMKFLKEKENLALETQSTLMKENKQLDLVCQELNELKDHTNHQEKLISESCRELNSLKGELQVALEETDLCKVEIGKLNQQLRLEMEYLRKADEERKMLRANIQEEQNTVLLVKEKERDHRKQMESIIVSVQQLSNTFQDFECRVAENVRRNNIRLEKLSCQGNSLIQRANLLRQTGLAYKQKLERRCSDLQKAEAEVDLLGDEVDVLLSLLEKIYIALDHYSPILQHYPGIMETLKLIQREVSGETIKTP